MNAFNKNSFRQKMFKCTVMVVILLQSACATQLSMVSREQNASICNFDEPGEVSARPKAQPIVQGDAHKGARIVLLLHNQQEIAGRLLSVRDGALVISTNEAQGNHIGAQTAGIIVVKKQDIRRMSIEDDLSVRKGAIIGFLIGAGTGAIVGFAAGDDTPCSESGPLAPCFSLTAEAKAVILGLLGGGAGLLVGAFVGAVASE
jgi:hypothetical protein